MRIKDICNLKVVVGDGKVSGNFNLYKKLWKFQENSTNLQLNVPLPSSHFQCVSI